MGLTWERVMLGEAKLRQRCLCPAVAGHVLSESNPASGLNSRKVVETQWRVFFFFEKIYRYFLGIRTPLNSAGADDPAAVDRFPAPTMQDPRKCSLDEIRRPISSNKKKINPQTASGSGSQRYRSLSAEHTRFIRWL